MSAATGRLRGLRAFAFLGPAAMVSVGYMDPGNWATDLEGGTRFGYQLIWVLVAANLMALVLQSLAARLGTAGGVDLAQACRAHYGRRLAMVLWVLAELAIVACDVAEVLGSAIALNMLFGIPMLAGACLTVLDVVVLLALLKHGRSLLEAIVITLVATVSVCLGVVLVLAQPSPSAVVGGLVPSMHPEAIYVAIGMLGATVMPHNLYLHSALVPKLRHASPTTQRAVMRKGFWSTALALNLALLVNVAILVVAASAFGQRAVVVTDLREAHRLLAPALGVSFASLLFALGLLCSGQSATITGTIAGQVVVEGFLRLRLSPVVRRMVTRGIAVVPAVIVLAVVGERGTTPMLVASQVVLSLQLPFAVIPLVRLTSSPGVMGGAVNRPAIRWLAAGIAVALVVANAALLVSTIQSWSDDAPALAAGLALAGAAGLALLIYVAVAPLEGVRATSDGAPYRGLPATGIIGMKRNVPP